jgi:chemosensory pili system protein ChpA (sensor histidine kinase/response regulator)
MAVSGDTVVDEGLNALSWVHDELRRSLEAAHKALRRYLRASNESNDLDPVDPAILRQARSQLHQAVGAVELVGLGPAGLVLRASESALQRLSMRPKLITQGAVDTIERGSFAVLDFIGRRLVNKPVTPLSLFPQYRVLQELAGASRIHPADLWPVSWSWRNLPADASVPPRVPDALAIAQIESDLLAQMRGAPPSVAARMSEVFAGLAAAQLQRLPVAVIGSEPTDHVPERQVATLFQLAAAFYEAQADGLLKADVYSKRIGSRLLAQLRAGVDSEPSQRLAHDLLFFCSQAAPRTGVPVLGLGSSGRLRTVRQGYALADEPVVDFEVSRLGRFDPAWVAQARKRVAAAKELWSAVAGGDLTRLAGLVEQMALVSESLQRLYPDGGVLGRALQAAAQATVNAQAEPPADLAMEVATALLYLDASLDDADFDQPELSQRVHRLAQRIDQVRQKRDPGMLELWMEDLYRRVSDRQTMGNVVQELRAALSEVEKYIDQYFRNPAQRDVLIPVPAQLQAMRGVLSVLGLDQASQAVMRMSEDVDALSDTEADPTQAIQSGSFDRLADNLGALSFLIDMVAVQPQMAKSLFRFDPSTGSLSAVMARQERPSGFGELDTGQGGLGAPQASPDTDAVAVSLEFDRIVKQAKAQQRHGPGERAGASGLPMLPGADPMADLRLGLADDALSPALPRSAHLQGAVWPVPPLEQDGLPGASAGQTAVVPLPADDQPEVDADMRLVFIEEARDVLQAARAGLDALTHAPDQRARIIDVRRAFHTLKGSSRMVGLPAFGEAAWACEQLFNARLAIEPPTTDAGLRDAAMQAVAYFDRWVQALADGNDTGFGPAPVLQAVQPQLAQAPRTELEAAAAPATPAPTTPAAAAPVSELQARVPSLPSANELDLPDLPTLPMDLSPFGEPAPEPPAPAQDAWSPALLPRLDLAGLGDDEQPTAPGVLADAEMAALPPAVEADAVGAPEQSLPALDEPLEPPAPEAVEGDAALPDLPALADGDAVQDGDDSLAADPAGPLAELAALPDLPAEDSGAPGVADGEAVPTDIVLPELDLSALDDEVGASPLALEATRPMPGPVRAPGDPVAEPSGMPGQPDLLLDLGEPGAGPDWEALDLVLGEATEVPARGAAEEAFGGPVQTPSHDGEVDLALDMAAPSPADPSSARGREASDAYKQIGPLRISQSLFNIFINEADDLSRQLGELLAAWRNAPERAPNPGAAARAHSLAGSSGTVGYGSLSHLARTLEHSLERAQARGRALGEEPELFFQAAEEIRRLLHLFAAGFLNQPDALLVQRLEVLAHAALDDEAALLAASTPMPLDDASDALPLYQLSDFGRSDMAPLDQVSDLTQGRRSGDELGISFDDEIDQVDAIDPELFLIFEEEGIELMPRLHASLRDWSRRPGETTLASAGMRSLHTFKGGARLAGAMRLGELAHRLETAIERLTGRAAKPTVADIEALMAHADVLDHQFDLLRGVPQPTQLGGLLTATDDLHDSVLPTLSPTIAVDWRLDDAVRPVVDATPPPPAPPPPPEPEPAPAALAVAVAPRPAAPAEVPRVALADEDELGLPTAPSTFDESAPEASSEAARESALGALADAPPAPLPEPAEPDIALSAAAATPAATPQPPPVPRIDWSRFMQAPALPIEQPAASRPATGSVRVRAAILDRLVGHSGEVSIARARLEADVQHFKSALGDLTDNLERLRAQLREIELQAETQIGSRLEAARAAQQQFDPLEMDRFTRFQELTRMMAESVSDVATVQRSLQRTLQSTEDTLAHQQRMSRDMQDDLLRTRLVEFEGLSERLYRVVRQAAKETGKQVRLDIVGGSIEVDRGVLDRMTPAFEHLLRNSVVHGIEPAAQRIVAGKDATGHISLTVGQIGNEVAVEVRDDGAGLHLDRILERARSSGLVGPDDRPDETELANLIFQPGFTTAHEVTEMAGRGVGMDVVRTEVNAIGGRIETASSPGMGTSFRLVLPLTTAVTQVVMLRCADRTVAVPSTLVESVTRVPPEELEGCYLRGLARVGDRELPFFWLDALLGGSARGAGTGRNVPIVVVRSANRRVVLHVDEVVSNQEVVVKHLGPQLSRLPGLVGMTLLASGWPSLIYNPVPLATLYGAQAHERLQALRLGMRQADAGDHDAGQTLAPLVMVVDDSLTVRRVTQRLLEREGYRVVLAKDGQDAMDRLSGELPRVVLSDIEMPRMDGFDLLRGLRASPRLAGLPVIMITSRLAQKHRDYAAELGANHYLGKPYAEDELLRLVGRYAPRTATA